mgnify:CR=1 FL=1
MGGTQRPRRGRSGGAPSVADVARLAGVSTQTVSRVSAGARNVRADTREKVLRAMERLGYSPNRAAQALRRGSFRTIGVVTQHIERTGEALTTEGVLAAAWRAGYTVSMIQVERPASEDMRTAVTHLAHQGVDGLVVVQAGRADSRHLVLPAGVPVAVSDSALVGYYPSASADQVRGVRAAVDHLNDIVIVDTAGRLQIDEEMMREAVDIKHAVKPDQILMVVDAMSGQDIVNVVKEFSERVDFDGVIMSKLDGDARGGGALSVREVTGKPIKFVSMGEKPDSLETFHPDRMAKRILGMGDVYGIIEQAQRVADEQQVADAERMLLEGFNMNDYLSQLQQIRKMGGISKMIGMLPGGERMMRQSGARMDESQLTNIESIIHSMTKEERLKPKKINGQRRRRIAAGSGHSVQEVNQVIKQWGEMNKMMGKMRQLAGSGSKRQMRQMKGMLRNAGGSMGALGGFGGKMPF